MKKYLIDLSAFSKSCTVAVIDKDGIQYTKMSYDDFLALQDGEKIVYGWGEGSKSPELQFQSAREGSFYATASALQTQTR